MGELKNEPFLWKGTSDRACLLLHGLGGGVYEMQLLGEVLHQQGFTVQGISYPGHDRPSPKMPHSTWPEWYGHALESYKGLAENYSEITLIGFSTGCPISLHLAATHPVSRLVMLAPYFAIRRRWYYLLPIEAYLYSIGFLLNDLPRFRLPIFDSEMQAAAQAIVFYKTFSVPAVRSANELIAQVKTEVPKIQVPTLIIQSPEDTIVEPSGAQWLYDHLRTSEKKLCWLKTSDHVVTLDREREEVFQQISTFLQ